MADRIQLPVQLTGLDEAMKRIEHSHARLMQRARAVPPLRQLETLSRGASAQLEADLRKAGVRSGKYSSNVMAHITDPETGATWGQNLNVSADLSASTRKKFVTRQQAANLRRNLTTVSGIEAAIRAQVQIIDDLTQAVRDKAMDPSELLRAQAEKKRLVQRLAQQPSKDWRRQVEEIQVLGAGDIEKQLAAIRSRKAAATKAFESGEIDLQTVRKLNAAESQLSATQRAQNRQRYGVAMQMAKLDRDLSSRSGIEAAIKKQVKITNDLYDKTKAGEIDPSMLMRSRAETKQLVRRLQQQPSREVAEKLKLYRANQDIHNEVAEIDKKKLQREIDFMSKWSKNAWRQYAAGEIDLQTLASVQREEISLRKKMGSLQQRERYQRRRSFGTGTMALSSTAIGLFGNAGFSALNIGFAALAGPQYAAAAAASLLIGGTARAVMRLQDASFATAESLGALSRDFKAARAEFEGVKAFFGSMQSLPKELAMRERTELLSKPGYIEPWLLAAELRERVTTTPMTQPWKLLAPPLILSDALKNVKEHRKNLLPALEESRESLFRSTNQFTAQLEAPEAVWRRIQTAAASRNDGTSEWERLTLKKFDELIAETKKANEEAKKRTEYENSLPPHIPVYH